MTATLRQAAAIAKAAKPGRVAVIDVGSNSVRLVVYDKRSRSLVPIFNEKALPGLGKGLERTGKLNAEGRKDALMNIRRFVALTRAMNVTDVEMLATAAVRDAKDGKEFAKEIERATGVAVRVISGEEEARLSALGVLAGVPNADGLMGDLGGGSLELVLLNKGKIAPAGDAADRPAAPGRGDRRRSRRRAEDHRPPSGRARLAAGSEGPHLLSGRRHLAHACQASTWSRRTIRCM